MNPNDQQNMPRASVDDLQPQTQIPTPTMPIPVPTPTVEMASNNNPVQQNKKVPILLIILGLMVALVFAGILAWIFAYSPSAQTKKTSNSFMNAATTGDKTTLFKLGDAENDESAKTFLEQSSASVMGSSALRQSTNKDSKWYYLYDLTNSTNKHARTTVEKKNGKWFVTSFVFGKETLALLPGKINTEPKTPVTTPDAPKVQTLCLEDSDVSIINDAKPADKGFGTDFEIDGYRKYVGQTYFFQPDSTTFVYADQAKTALDKVKTFYEANKTKEFTLHLSGKVREASSTSSGTKLAHDRVAKLKTELESRGIPANVIVEDEPQQSSATYNDGSERNVDLDIRKNIPCTTKTPSNR